MKLPEDEFGEEQVNKTKQLAEDTSKKITEALNSLISMRKKFSEKYKFKIEDS